MSVSLSKIGTYASGIFDDNAAEIVAHDPQTQRLFVANGSTDAIDVLSIKDPHNPTKLFAFGDLGGSPNSVAVRNGLVAVAVDDDGEPGSVRLFDAGATGDEPPLADVPVGVVPDMVTFTPDGRRVLVANEGEAEDGVDPEGSITIIDVSKGAAAAAEHASTVDFSRFDGQEEALRAEGIRLFPGISASRDLEPEFIAVSPDGCKAYVTLQENNALAVVNVNAKTVEALLPLGAKDHGLSGNGLDASDEDGGSNIANWPVSGLYMPDGIDSFEVCGQVYYVTASEGDRRDNDTERAGNLTLDATAFPDADELQQEAALGRLRVSTIDGDRDGDGDYDELFSFGARSFAIWDTAGKLVFESGDQFEQIIARELPEFFNSDQDDNDSFDEESPNQGPQPEGVAVGEIDDHVYAFIGLENIGGVMVYDVTNPREARFTQYINTRDFSGDPAAGTAGDLAPEGLAFIAAEDSPTGKPLLAGGFEVSGTTTLYEIDPFAHQQLIPENDSLLV